MTGNGSFGTCASSRRDLRRGRLRLQNRSSKRLSLAWLGIPAPPSQLVPDSPLVMNDDAPDQGEVFFHTFKQKASSRINRTSSILYTVLCVGLTPSLASLLRMPTITFTADLTCRYHSALSTWPPASKPSLPCHSYVLAARTHDYPLRGCTIDPRHRLPPRHPLLCVMGQLPPPTCGRHLCPCTSTELDMWEVFQP